MENRKWVAIILACGPIFATGVSIRAQEKKVSERMIIAADGKHSYEFEYEIHK